MRNFTFAESVFLSFSFHFQLCDEKLSFAGPTAEAVDNSSEAEIEIAVELGFQIRRVLLPFRFEDVEFVVGESLENTDDRVSAEFARWTTVTAHEVERGEAV